MQRFLILIGAVTLASRLALASPSSQEDPLISYSISNEGRTTRVHVFKSRVEYLTGEKTFSIELAPIASDDLFNLWKPAKGEKKYSVEAWPQEFSCGSLQRWRVSASGETRTVCRNSALLKRLNDFHDSVLSLF